MRVLILGDAFFVPIVNLSRFLVDAGHDVHLATIRGGATPPGVTRHEIRGAARLGILLARGAVGKLAATIHPDVVHAFYLTSYGFLATGARGTPILASATGTDLFGAPELATWLGPLRRQLGRIAVRGASHVHSVAEHMNPRLIEWGARPAAITTFPRGIDLVKFRFAPRTEIAAPTVRLLCNRKLEPVYDHATLIAGFALARQRGLDARLRILGDGFLREALVDQTERLGIADGVQFDGAIRHDEMPRALQEAELLISASTSDGTSSCLLEALAVGTIPVVSNIAANHPWVKDGATGFLFEPGDADSLARALERTVAARDRWPAIRAAGRELVERDGDLEKGHRRTLEIYDRVLGKY